jgi:hypothetical protein
MENFMQVQRQCGEQQPDTFKQIVEGIQDIWGKVTEKTEGYLQKKLMQKSFFRHPLDEIYELLKLDLTAEVTEKLKNFKKQISFIMKELIYDERHFFCGYSW